MLLVNVPKIVFNIGKTIDVPFLRGMKCEGRVFHCTKMIRLYRVRFRARGLFSESD
jgi:hypothetical protein